MAGLKRSLAEAPATKRARARKATNAAPDRIQRALLLPPVGWPLYLITLKPLLYHRINGGGGEIRTRGPASRAMPVSTGDTEADLSCRSLSCWNRPEGALAGPEPLDNNP